MSFATTLAQVTRLKTPEVPKEQADKTDKRGSVGSVSEPAAHPEDAGRAIRRAWADSLCNRLSRQVAALSFPGLGSWPDAWEIVEGPSKRFLEALALWEEKGGAAEKTLTLETCEAVLKSWQDAAAQWRQAHPDQA